MCVNGMAVEKLLGEAIVLGEDAALEKFGMEGRENVRYCDFFPLGFCNIENSCSVSFGIRVWWRRYSHRGFNETKEGGYDSRRCNFVGFFFTEG